jgi:large subunit ribosomal protein L14e
MEDIALGQIVHSRAGRDSGRYFIVVGIVDHNYVLVADGDLRKISSPKKKKVRHLVFHDKVSEDVKNSLMGNKRITDADLRKSLQSMGLI